MIKRVFLIVPVCIALAVCTALVETKFVAKPSRQEDWISLHRNEIDALVTAKNCDGLWNLLWPEARNGNLQARYMLMQYVYPPPKRMRMELPGHPDSDIDTARDAMILGVHSLGMENVEKYEAENLNWRHSVFEVTIKKEDYPEFHKCYATEKSSACLKLALDKNIVPPFDIFAEEIDKYANRGATPICLYGDDAQVDFGN